jgi:hypothetical protein
MNDLTTKTFYYVTTCVQHGQKFTSDLKSQVLYIELAEACVADLNTDEEDHEAYHTNQGHDCWVCCPKMVIAHKGDFFTETARS